MAKDADVLVHEAMYVPAVESYVKDQVAKGRPVSVEAFIAHMKADHSPVEDVGRIAAEAGVKTLHRHVQCYSIAFFETAEVSQ